MITVSRNSSQASKRRDIQGYSMNAGPTSRATLRPYW
jgi:hypothetical protein